MMMMMTILMLIMIMMMMTKMTLMSLRRPLVQQQPTATLHATWVHTHGCRRR